MLHWLSGFSDAIGALNVLRYITFRSGGAMITALALVFMFGPRIIARLRLMQQPLRDDMPQSHDAKEGTVSYTHLTLPTNREV